MHHKTRQIPTTTLSTLLEIKLSTSHYGTQPERVVEIFAKRLQREKSHGKRYPDNGLEGSASERERRAERAANTSRSHK